MERSLQQSLYNSGCCPRSKSKQGILFGGCCQRRGRNKTATEKAGPNKASRCDPPTIICRTKRNRTEDAPFDGENPNSVWSPETDSGTVKPFKYSFSLARKRIESGGWTRQLIARELPISTTSGG